MCMIHIHMFWLQDWERFPPKRNLELLYFDHASQLTNELQFLPLK